MQDYKASLWRNVNACVSDVITVRHAVHTLL